MRSWDVAQGVGARVVNHLLFYASTINLDPGDWTVLGGGGDTLADGGPSSATSSSSSSLQTQELSLLMPGNVPWWPRHNWDAWLQRNVTETTRELDMKLDVTPETNDTSTSEVASRPSYAITIFDINYLLEYVCICTCALFMLAISAIVLTWNIPISFLCIELGKFYIIILKFFIQKER